MGIYRAVDSKQPPKRPEELLGRDKRSDMMWALLLICWDHNPNARPDAPTVRELVRTEQAFGLDGSNVLLNHPA